MKCKFDRAWIGPCGDPADSSGFCEKHKNMECCSCGKQAVRECDQTGIQFVCGYPLCATCKHGVPEKGKEGMFMLGGGHVTEEVYKKQWQEWEKKNGMSNL